MARASTRRRAPHAGTTRKPGVPGQVVLVLQGGGALGAYQVGVYEALHQSGIEPDWVIGTSIGAINAALIAGNPPEQRLDRLTTFWRQVEHSVQGDVVHYWTGLANLGVNLATLARGIPAFFSPNPAAWLGPHARVGLDHAAWYTTAPLRESLPTLVDFGVLNRGTTRLTVGAVSVLTGEMRYFDSRDEALTLEHVLASGALPPAFPAVRVDGEPYWDGGIYSNTPIEAVLDDKPRRDSLIFAVHMWNPQGAEPDSLWQVMSRHKDIQYASRARSHVARQKQIHHLRHIIRELVKHLPADERESASVRELAAWGCGTTMHVAQLVAPSLQGEDHTKDIDFTPAGIRTRWRGGHGDTLRFLERAPWEAPADPMEGIVIHEAPARAGPPVAPGVDGFEGRTR